MLPDPVSKAIDSIYLAGFDRKLWAEGLDRLCVAIGADAAITVPRVAAENTIYLPFSPQLEEFAGLFVADGWYQRDLRADRGWPLTDQGQRIVLEQDIVTADDHAHQPIYQELLLPHGVKWWAGITFHTPVQQFVLSVCRHQSREPFSETDRALFDIISDHLARAVAMAERMARVAADASLSALEAIGEAAIVLDGSGKVLAMTRRAEQVMGDGLYILSGRLKASARKADEALRALLEPAIGGNKAQRGPVQIPRLGKRPLMADCIPVPERFDRGFLFARTIVLLTDPGRQPVPNATILRQVFAFSPSECRLAQALAAGFTLTEAAERRSISRETARSHLKSMFYKTGTNRQSDLVVVLHNVARRAWS